MNSDEKTEFISASEASDSAESKEAAVAVSAVDERLRQGRQAVHKLTQYVNRVLNVELWEFFDDHCGVFEQDLDDLDCGRGETLEQYSVFKDYERLVTRKLDDFVEEEGYTSVAELFSVVQDACREDKKRAEKHMKSLMAQLKQFQRQIAMQMKERVEAASSEAKSGDDAADLKESKNPMAEDVPKQSKVAWGEEDDLKSEDKVEESKSEEAKSQGFELPMLVFKPTTLEDLVQSILNVATYETFSRLMRAKAMTKAFQTRVQETADKAATDRAYRQQVFQISPRRSSLCEMFEMLRTRMLNLLPQYDISNARAKIRENFTDELFEDALAGEGKMLLELLQRISKQLAYFSGPFNVSQIVKDLVEFKTRLGLPEEPGNAMNMFFGGFQMQRARLDRKASEPAEQDQKTEPNSLDEVEAFEFCKDLLKFTHEAFDKIEDRTLEMVRMQRGMQQQMLRKMRQDIEDQRQKRLEHADRKLDDSAGDKQVAHK